MTAVAELALAALARASGLDLVSYREAHVAERVRRALAREGVADAEELARLLEEDSAARSRFRRSVAVSVSGVFRDPGQFDVLEELLPAVLGRSRRFHGWSAGCADGSELYTLALVLRRFDALGRSFLLGSDLLEENLELARAGVYGGEVVGPEIRARLHWEQRDLLRDGAPPGKWQAVLCRNVGIYLAQAPKARLHALLAGSLALGGLLILGRSERIADGGSMGLEQAAPHVYRRIA